MACKILGITTSFPFCCLLMHFLESNEWRMSQLLVIASFPLLACLVADGSLKAPPARQLNFVLHFQAAFCSLLESDNSSSSLTSISVLPGHSPSELSFSISTALFSVVFKDFQSQFCCFRRFLTFLTVDISCA